MGGAPTISGGMSQAEYQKLLDEQRVYADEAEAKREAKLAEYEQNRIKAEKDLLEAQKLAEQQKIAAQQDAEAQIASEVQAIGQQEQTKKASGQMLGADLAQALLKGIAGTTGQERPK